MIESLSISQIIFFATALIAGAFLLFGFARGRKPRVIPKKLQRSNDYRMTYFEHNKGLFGKGIFFCPFCGKLMWKKEQIQIDHINSIHRVQRSKFLRERIKKFPGGVNDIKNLVHSCPRCNRRKGSKGGIWVFLGCFGQYFMPVLRWAVYGIAIYAVGSAVLFGGWSL